MGPVLRSRVGSQGVEQVPVVIIGGGICGLLAAERCVREGIAFVLFERSDVFGGNWVVRANTYSHLQARPGSLTALLLPSTIPYRAGADEVPVHLL